VTTLGLLRDRHVSLALLLALLAGCATVSFKPGASPQAMEADERACREASRGEASFTECMRNRGWYMRGTGAAEAAPPLTPAAPAQLDATPSAPPARSFTAAAAMPIPTPSAPAAPSTPLLPAAPPSTPTTTPAEPTDPLAEVEVGSWWKLGGTPAELDRAIDACVAELGPAHRPVPNATVVTAGLRACLRKAGWFGVGRSIAP